MNTEETNALKEKITRLVVGRTPEEWRAIAAPFRRLADQISRIPCLPSHQKLQAAMNTRHGFMEAYNAWMSILGMVASEVEGPGQCLAISVKAVGTEIVVGAAESKLPDRRNP